MTFNDDAKLEGGKVRRRGRTTGLAIGGGGLGVVVLLLLGNLLGVDLSSLNGLVGGEQSTSEGDYATVEQPNCQTGEDANTQVDCRLEGAAESLDRYWTQALPTIGGTYTTIGEVALFDGATTTGCGSATSATGPFYCPADQNIYIDTTFFDELRTRFGSSGGSLAQMYILGHEWGHHIQQISGIMEQADRSGTGPDSDSVRIELQADCLAGAWIGDASQVKDSEGTAFLKQPTDAEITDALSAAAAVGDDRIQEASTGQVNPEGWTHGSSEQRERWFLAGYTGSPASCNTFTADTL